MIRVNGNTLQERLCRAVFPEKCFYVPKSQASRAFSHRGSRRGVTALVEPLPRAAWTGQRKEGPQGPIGDAPSQKGAVLGEEWGELARKNLAPPVSPQSQDVGTSRSGGWVSGPFLGRPWAGLQDRPSWAPTNLVGSSRHFHQGRAPSYTL